MQKGFRKTAVGVMSGTSLDGLDLCFAEFHFDGNWRFEITQSDCVNYDYSWREKLSSAHQLSDQELALLNRDFGGFIGESVNSFLRENGLTKPELVCSHGHTVLHQPEKGITLQIGDGQVIANKTEITCVSDFRSLDVSLGGQGAPLVPIGDELLFSEYDACLNLGGFSNISFKENGARKAFDICPVNIALNPLANELGFEYDKGGKMAQSGNLSPELLETLNYLNVYHNKQRPSLAREWLEMEFIPLIHNSEIPTEDKLRTVTEHAALQIARIINNRVKNGKVLVTGGGAKNAFLMERLSSLSDSEIQIPEKTIIDYKEALIFAFLGVLRSENQINILRSVTGAERDSCSGVIHCPNSRR